MMEKFWSGAEIRRGARIAMAIAIALLLFGALGAWSKRLPVWLAAVSVIVTTTANAILIANATQSSEKEQQFLPVAATDSTTTRSSPQELNRRTCIQGYAMIPITAASIVSLAMYKAIADVQNMDNAKDKLALQPAAVAFLEFVGFGRVLHFHQVHESSIISLHGKFLQGVIFASLAYLVIHGLRAMLTASKWTQEDDEACNNTVPRMAARAAFGLAIVLLIFAAIGFAPLAITSIACAASVLATLVLLMQETGFRTTVQTHAFSLVTLACIHCLGSQILEMKAAEPHMDQTSLHLHSTAFNQAYFAACWLAGTTAIRDVFNVLSAQTQAA